MYVLWIIALKDLYIIWFSNLSGLSVPNVGYSRNASCALNLISMFLFIVCVVFFLSTYSTEADASLSDGLSDSMKILIGALVGGVLLFVLVVILIACLLRRKKKKSSEQ